MRTHPEDPKKAIVRAELKEKPKSRADIKDLKKSFNFNASSGKVERAHTALNLLPKDEQNKLDKSDYFQKLIKQGRTDIIDETLKNGTPKDQQQLYIETLKIEEQVRIDNILTSMSKAKAQPAKKTQTSHLFSTMKNKLNTMLGRSAPIAPENLSKSPENTDMGDDKTASMSSDNSSNGDYLEHDTDHDHDDNTEDRSNFDNRM